MMKRKHVCRKRLAHNRMTKAPGRSNAPEVVSAVLCICALACLAVVLAMLSQDGNAKDALGAFEKVTTMGMSGLLGLIAGRRTG
jgi:hypothetical protein